MSFLHLADKIRLRFGRYKVGAPTTNSQPGAHTGNSRQYIPGYSDSNIVSLDTASGNDSNDGSTELLAKLTYASAATAAGSTKKIRVINDGAALSTDITNPTEMKRGVSGTISSSLTAPVDTWTQSTTLNSFSGSINGMAWAPWVSRYIGVGGTSKVYLSADGDTWTAAASHGFGSDAPLCIAASNSLGKAFIAGQAAKFGYSSDGSSYTVASISAMNGKNINCIAYSESENRIFVVGDEGYTAYSDDEGVTWAEGPRLGQNSLVGIATNGTVWTVVDNTGSPFYFSTPSSVSLASGGAGTLRAVFYSSVLNKFLYADENGDTYFSSNGATLTAADTPAFTSDGAFGFAESSEIGRVVAFGAGEIAYSADGNAWTLSATDSYGTTNIYCGAWSPLTGKFASAGVSKAAYSTAFANTISANIAGFTVQAMQYSGTVTAYNCTMKQPGTTAALSLNDCRVTEPGAHISNNAQAHLGTLFDGDAFFTSAPASQNAFALNCNTFAGSVYLYNSSATNYEQIRDNVIVGDFTASFAAPMLSGNLQGTNTNGILAKAVTLSDPAFVNTTDYKLKRLTNGDSQDSPLCNAAVYYVNEQGQPRDMGAWSEDDSGNAIDYRYSYFIDKPAGNGIRPQKIVAASADQGMDGTWDSVNEPERASEYLTITYSAAVSREHVTIQDLLESLIDMTCEVSLTPDLSDPDTAVTVNGNHSIGDIVLNIDASSTIKAGMVLPIGGVNYFILYTASGSSPTKLVLHKPLESAVSDNTVITPQEPAAYGTYQYIPQSREIPRPTKMETDYVNGVSFKFVRQYPQV